MRLQWRKHHSNEYRTYFAEQFDPGVRAPIALGLQRPDSQRRSRNFCKHKSCENSAATINRRQLFHPVNDREILKKNFGKRVDRRIWTLQQFHSEE